MQFGEVVKGNTVMITDSVVRSAGPNKYGMELKFKMSKIIMFRKNDLM